jgi:flagellar biosynthesis protein FlhB
MKNNKEITVEDKKVKLTKLQKSIYNARNLIELLKSFVLVAGIFCVVIIILAIIRGNLDGISIGSDAYKDLIGNRLIEFIILMPLMLASITCLWLSLKHAVEFLDNILKISIFSEQSIKSIDMCLKYLIIFWITIFAATLNLNIAVIIIIVMVNLCKHIFIYGHNLEKEISEVI